MYCHFTGMMVREMTFQSSLMLDRDDGLDVERLA